VEVEPEAGQMTLSLSSTQTSASCPICHQLSRRIHSRYDRTLRDLNWAEGPVVLHLEVGKFFCDNPSCQRRIFAQRLPQITAPGSRRTHRMTQQLGAIGLALGGAAGARLMSKLGYSFSRDTVLRCLSKMPLPTVQPPKQVGVDDFAFRKGQRYGTIVVDLEQGCPVALLKDREAGTLAAWLAQYPEIEVLTRDRAKAYRQGMNDGAPQAMQVADRFHLLQNLVEPLEQVFRTHRPALNEIEQATGTGEASVVVLPPPNPFGRADAQHQTQRQKRYEKIQ